MGDKARAKISYRNCGGCQWCHQKKAGDVHSPDRQLYRYYCSNQDRVTGSFLGFADCVDPVPPTSLKCRST